MTSLGRRPAQRRGWQFAVLAVALVLMGAIALWRPSAQPTELAAAPSGAPVAAPARITLPEAPRVLIFGDSWTYGSAADVPADGYAYAIGRTLGWETHVDGVRGSGYLKPGADGGSFGERIADLDPGLDPDLVIIQGSINDRVLYPDGYREAVTSAWDAVSRLYPDASFVILGPAPQVLPVERATARIDVDLEALAAQRGWWYISPIQDDWITPDNYHDVIDTGVGRNHPSTAGHAYLAERLADALATLTEAPDVVADAPVEDGTVVEP